MAKYTNQTNIPVSIAVFLATDHYDYSDDSISVTTLLKPTRQTVLASRLDKTQVSVDLSALIASRLGSAIHNGIEHAWVNNHHQALLDMGTNANVAKRYVINPDENNLPERAIPVYLERRASKKVGNYTIVGKFDIVMDGRVEDFKTTSVYTAMLQTNSKNYVLQGSMYRWLNPKIITSDQMAIQFIFTDWSGAKARSEKNYPQSRHMEQVFNLLSLESTERHIQLKLTELAKYWRAPESEIPLCTDEELWRSEPVFKYYKNPDKLKRSTKNFDTLAEANLRRATEGVGVVIERPGEVTACKYCPAFSLCSQKDSLIEQGQLVL